LRLQKSLKVAFSIEFGETSRNICCVELFQFILFDLFIANSWKSIHFAYKPNLQWGMNHFDYIGIRMKSTVFNANILILQIQ